MLNAKDTEILLKFFGIKSLPELIGRKLLINYTHKNTTDDELIDWEICFLITQYSRLSGCVEFIVPTTGIEDDKKYGKNERCILGIFPHEEEIAFAISLSFDNTVEHERTTFETSDQEKDPDQTLKVQLL